MKMATMRLRSGLKTVLFVMLVVGAFVSAANAQSSFTGRFTLPYEAHWGTAVLPAGEYIVTVDSFHTATLVQSAKNDQAFYTRIPMIDDSDKGTARLVVTSVQGERRIRSMNLPGSGKLLVYEPISKAEREQLAKAGQIEAVPVFSAKK